MYSFRREAQLFIRFAQCDQRDGDLIDIPSLPTLKLEA